METPQILQPPKVSNALKFLRDIRVRRIKILKYSEAYPSSTILTAFNEVTPFTSSNDAKEILHLLKKAQNCCHPHPQTSLHLQSNNALYQSPSSHSTSSWLPGRLQTKTALTKTPGNFVLHPPLSQNIPKLHLPYIHTCGTRNPREPPASSRASCTSSAALIQAAGNSPHSCTSE